MTGADLHEIEPFRFIKAARRLFRRATERLSAIVLSLDAAEEGKTEALLAPKTMLHRARRTLLGLILADPEPYLRLFLGDNGYIARAERFDYPKPNEEDAAFPAEFFSLVDFMNYCADTFPEHVPLHRVPKRFVEVISRRFREGKRIEWLDQDPRVVAMARDSMRRSMSTPSTVISTNAT